jgi:molybdopterin molybdotransferase
LKRVSDHLSDVLDAVAPLEPIDVALLDAHGCVAAEDVVAPWALPPYDQATVDGYAVRAIDVADASPDAPALLAVTADVDAGRPSTVALAEGLAARVVAGSPLPAGADTVVRRDDTDGGYASVAVHAPAAVGSGVRQRADDVDAGDIVVRVGTFLGAAQVGLLAAVGKDLVRVRPRPRVVVLAVGSELVEPGLPVTAASVTDSTSLLLTAGAREAGAVVYRVAPVPDDADVLRRTLEDQLVRADLVVLSGGLTGGAEVVRQVLPTLGDVTFESVAVHPASVQGFGRLGDDAVPVFALPGTPVSAFLAFEVFVRPAVRRMLGSTRLHRPTVRARLTAPLESPAGVREFARARVRGGTGEEEPSVEPLTLRDVPHITDLARANALVVVPEATTRLDAGDPVECVLLERRRG